ncbi:ABC transporter permease [Psychrobacter sp. N25K4-3-2]|uniref:ABC transporter permease n=1 Tax=Psychrobacter sp. N25K4-3-2 TaxID=2785026 RepID=UPI00188CEE8E|nr:ABC transporter permease [Psychrobacter sp. N25K4-3-2]MBF4490701.1 ABC transporter permease [Psychrobacter sp. N25K4-3-2]
MQTFKNIWTLTIKELRSLFGDKILFLMIGFVFSVTIYTVAEGINTDVRNAPVGIIDLDRTALTRQIRDALQQPYFLPPVDVKREDVDELMDKSKLIFVLEFPPGFERDVLAGRKPQVQLLIDATTMTQAGIGQAYILQIFNQEVSDFLKQADPPLLVKPVLNMIFNPNGDSYWYTPVMEVCNMIALLAIGLSGAAVIRERERGTIEHLLVMPVNTTEIVISKILANSLVILCASMLSMVFVVQYLLGIPINGSLLLFGSGVVVYLFSISSLGIMLSTMAPSMPQFALLMLPVLVVSLLLSGSIAPRSNMPEAAQMISEYWPTTQFVSFTQNVLFRNAGLDIVWPELLVMTGIGVVFLIFALVRFKAMLEKLG